MKKGEKCAGPYDQQPNPFGYGNLNCYPSSSLTVYVSVWSFVMHLLEVTVWCMGTVFI